MHGAKLADVGNGKAMPKFVTTRSRWGDFAAIRRSGVVFDALSTRARRMERGRCHVVSGLRVLREGRDRPTRRDRISYRTVSWRRDQKVALSSVATTAEGAFDVCLSDYRLIIVCGNASDALAHVVLREHVGPYVRDYETERCAMVLARLTLWLWWYLVVVVNINGVRMSQCLVDSGASINLVSLDTLNFYGVTLQAIRPSAITVMAYDNTSRSPKGVVALKVGLGLSVTEMDFHILDMDLSFRMILGRPFIQALGAVISTVHQCRKFPYKGRVLKVASKPTIFEVDARTDNSIPSIWRSNKPLMFVLDTVSMYPDLSSLSVSTVKRSKIMTKKGWHIMLQMGYQPGKGLGVHLQGRTEAVKDIKMRSRAGLGYKPGKTDHQQGQPLTWTLYQHFKRGPLQPGREQTSTITAEPEHFSILTTYAAVGDVRPPKQVKRGESKSEWGRWFDMSDIATSLDQLFTPADTEQLVVATSKRSQEDEAESSTLPTRVHATIRLRAGLSSSSSALTFPPSSSNTLDLPSSLGNASIPFSPPGNAPAPFSSSSNVLDLPSSLGNVLIPFSPPGNVPASFSSPSNALNLPLSNAPAPLFSLGNALALFFSPGIVLSQLQATAWPSFISLSIPRAPMPHLATAVHSPEQTITLRPPCSDPSSLEPALVSHLLRLAISPRPLSLCALSTEGAPKMPISQWLILSSPSRRPPSSPRSVPQLTKFFSTFPSTQGPPFPSTYGTFTVFPPPSSSPIQGISFTALNSSPSSPTRDSAFTALPSPQPPAVDSGSCSASLESMRLWSDDDSFEEGDEEFEDEADAFASGLKRFDEPSAAVEETTKEINLGTEKNSRTVLISSNLSPAEEEAIIEVLREYNDTFAWSYEDMPGLDTALVEHHLTLKPGSIAIKQRLR
ncbi:hypothetical protein Taro_008649, partial [Colocasia esculenta]|nr:hypothetical protein [Colocasia esculenta]